MKLPTALDVRLTIHDIMVILAANQKCVEEDESMTEYSDYLEWLNECRGGDYTVKVKFKNAPRDERLIKDGMVAFEDVLSLCAKLSETGWRMTFDDYPSQIIKLEIDAIGRRVILRVIRDIDSIRPDQENGGF